jgi:hypothetical protein
LGNLPVVMERSPAPGPPELPFSAIPNEFTPSHSGNGHASLRAARSRRATPVQGAFAWGALLMPGGCRSVAPARPRRTGHRQNESIRRGRVRATRLAGRTSINHGNLAPSNLSAPPLPAAFEGKIGGRQGQKTATRKITTTKPDTSSQPAGSAALCERREPAPVAGYRSQGRRVCRHHAGGVVRAKRRPHHTPENPLRRAGKKDARTTQLNQHPPKRTISQELMRARRMGKKTPMPRARSIISNKDRSVRRAGKKTPAPRTKDVTVRPCTGTQPR